MSESQVWREKAGDSPVAETPLSGRAVNPPPIRVASLFAEIFCPWQDSGDAARAEGVAVEALVREAIRGVLPSGWTARVGVRK